jgi:hypothetical protein
MGKAMKRILAIGFRRKSMLPDYMTAVGAIKMARANGGAYTGDSLTEGAWEWPKDGFLTKRLAKIRSENAGDSKLD